MALIKIDTTTFNNAEVPVYLASGTATRDAEDKPVNGKEHSVVGIAATKDSSGNTVYINLNGWRDSAPLVRAICKGDNILAIGALKKRVYNERDYYDLDVNFVAKSGAGLTSSGVDFGGCAELGFEEIPDTGELPF